MTKALFFCSGKTVVVFVVGTSEGEVGGFYGLPPVDDVAVNELRTITAVEPDMGLSTS